MNIKKIDFKKVRPAHVLTRAVCDILTVAGAFGSTVLVMSVLLLIPEVRAVVLQPTMTPFLILTVMPSFFALMLNRFATHRDYR